MITVVGARPNFIKAMPLCAALAGHTGRIRHMLVHTGQHYDYRMSEAFFEQLRIPKPDIHLDAGGEGHAAQTADIMVKFEKVCVAERPDWVTVIGDVNSALAASLTARKLGVNVAHVEAGLRSNDMSMPEEVNRRVVDAIADLLFAPSEDAVKNLRHEGVAPDKIILAGNIMIDALVARLPEVDAGRNYEKWGVQPGRFAYVTLHRPGNVDRKETFDPILDALCTLAKDLKVIFPIHPRTRARLEEWGWWNRLEREGLMLADPLPYYDSISLAKNAAVVITDSGGLQEETSFLGTPCLTMRPNTERPATITHGTNRLTTASRLAADTRDVLARLPSAPRPIPYWDGKAAIRMADAFAAIAAKAK